jgi:hypothetical protein
MWAFNSGRVSASGSSAEPHNLNSNLPLQAWIRTAIDVVVECLSPYLSMTTEPLYIDVDIIPPLIVPFAPDGIFLRNWSKDGRQGQGLALFPSVFNTPDFRNSAHALTSAATFILHEVYPGHAFHLHCSADRPYSELFQVWKSPVTFEGWASYAEGLASFLFPNSETLLSVKFNRLRRLIPTYMLLEQNTDSKEKILSCLSSLPWKARKRLENFCQARFGLVTLPYAIGLAEVHHTIKAFGGMDFSDAYSLTATQFLLSAGPLSPSTMRAFDLKPTTDRGT